MTEFLEAAEEAVEELFPPRPGGLVDKHRQRKAEREAALQEQINADEPVEQPAYKAVKVAPESPEVFSPVTITIGAGGYAMILPLNLYRYRATMKLVTATSTAILAKDSGGAISGTGYTMATADPPLVLFSRGQLWAFNPGGSPIQISVISELYAPEKK